MRGADRSADWRRSPTLLTTRGLNSRYHLQILLSVLLARSLSPFLLSISLATFYRQQFLREQTTVLFSAVVHQLLRYLRGVVFPFLCLYCLLDFLFFYCWLHTGHYCLCVQFCMQPCCVYINIATYNSGICECRGVTQSPASKSKHLRQVATKIGVRLNIYRLNQESSVEESPSRRVTKLKGYRLKLISQGLSRWPDPASECICEIFQTLSRGEEPDGKEIFGRRYSLGPGASQTRWKGGQGVRLERCCIIPLDW